MRGSQGRAGSSPNSPPRDHAGHNRAIEVNRPYLTQPHFRFLPGDTESPIAAVD